MRNKFVEFNVGNHPKKNLYAYLEDTGVTHVELITGLNSKKILVMGVPVNDWYRTVLIFKDREKIKEPYRLILLPLNENNQCTPQSFADLFGGLLPEEAERCDSVLRTLFNYTCGTGRRETMVWDLDRKTIADVMPSWARAIRNDNLFYNRVFIRIGNLPLEEGRTDWILEWISAISSENIFVSASFKAGKKKERYTEGTIGAHVLKQLCRRGFGSSGLPEGYRSNPEFYVFCREQEKLLGKCNPYTARNVKAHHLYQIFDKKVSPVLLSTYSEFYKYALMLLVDDYWRLLNEGNPLGIRFAHLNSNSKTFILKQLLSADTEQELYIREVVNSGVAGSFYDYAALVRSISA